MSVTTAIHDGAKPEHAVVTVCGKRGKDGTWSFYEQTWLDAHMTRTTTRNGKQLEQAPLHEYLTYSSRKIYPPE